MSLSSVHEFSLSPTCDDGGPQATRTYFKRLRSWSFDLHPCKRARISADSEVVDKTCSSSECESDIQMLNTEVSSGTLLTRLWRRLSTDALGRLKRLKARRHLFAGDSREENKAVTRNVCEIDAFFCGHTSMSWPLARWVSVTSSKACPSLSVLLSRFGSDCGVCLLDLAGVRISPYIVLRATVEVSDILRDTWLVTRILSRHYIGLDPITILLKQPIDIFHVLYTFETEELSWRTIGAVGTGTFASRDLDSAWIVAPYDEQREAIVGPLAILETDVLLEDPYLENGLGLLFVIFRVVANNKQIRPPRFPGDVTEENKDIDFDADYISNTPSGLMVFSTVRGVQFPNDRKGCSNMFDDELLETTVSITRRSPTKFQYTSIVHHVITSTIGIPLWEYEKEAELARAMISVLETHRTLYERNILHRDLNPENVLLVDPEIAVPGQEGIILDFEYAVVREKWLARERSKYGPTVSALKTGSLQFAALDVLMAIDRHKKNGKRHPTFKHSRRHDLESIVWVLAFILLKKMFYLSRKAYDRRPREFLDSTFNCAFGKRKLSDIIFQRELVSPLVWTEERSWNPLVETSLSPKFGDVMEKLFRKMRRIFYGKNGKNFSQLRTLKMWDPDTSRYGNESDLTHKYLTDLFRQIIEDDDSSANPNV